MTMKTDARAASALADTLNPPAVVVIPEALRGLRLLRDEILILRDVAHDVSQGGSGLIHLPKNRKQQRLEFATVLAVGPGERRYRRVGYEKQYHEESKQWVKTLRKVEVGGVYEMVLKPGDRVYAHRLFGLDIVVGHPVAGRSDPAIRPSEPNGEPGRTIGVIMKASDVWGVLEAEVSSDTPPS